MVHYLSPEHAELFSRHKLTDFRAWWEAEGIQAEPPNRRRGGWSEVRQVRLRDQGDTGSPSRVFYLKRQENHYYRDPGRFFTRRLTAFREFRALTTLSRFGVSVPRPVFFAATRNGADRRALLVTAALTGFQSLKDWIRHWEKTDWPPRAARLLIIRAVAREIAALHRHGWSHRALHAKHVFIKWHPDDSREPEACLIDLESARPARRRTHAIINDLGPLYRRTPQLTNRDRALFMQCYASVPRLGKRERDLITAISADGFHPVDAGCL